MPDLFELPVIGGVRGERRWVLTVNVGDHAAAGGSGGQYCVGDFDGTRFRPMSGWGDVPRCTGYGSDFYAAVSWNDLPRGDPRRLWIGWASNWRYAEAIPTDYGRSVMTVPREVTLRRTGGGYRLAQQPAPELQRLRAAWSREDWHWMRRPYRSRSRATARTCGSCSTSPPAVRPSYGWRTGRGTICASGSIPRQARCSSTAAGQRRVTLHILFDRSIVELFAADGTRVITDRYFLTGADRRWSASTSGGAATLRLRAWPMRDPQKLPAATAASP